jgi:hypothetical protein
MPVISRNNASTVDRRLLPVHLHDPVTRYIRADDQNGCNKPIISCPVEGQAALLSGYAHYSPKVSGLKLTFVPPFKLDNV